LEVENLVNQWMEEMLNGNGDGDKEGWKGEIKNYELRVPLTGLGAENMNVRNVVTTPIEMKLKRELKRDKMKNKEDEGVKEEESFEEEEDGKSKQSNKRKMVTKSKHDLPTFKKRRRK